MYTVLDSNNRIKFAGTEAACKAWIRSMRAEFFCRVALKPMTDVLQACVEREQPKTPTTMGMPASVWSVIPLC